MQQIIDQILPELSALGAALFSMFLLWIGSMLRSKLKLSAEETKKVLESFDRQALHMALETAASIAKARGLKGASALDFIANYVFKSTPGALDDLKVSISMLHQLAESKIADGNMLEIKVPDKNLDELKEALKNAVTDQLTYGLDNIQELKSKPPFGGSSASR